MVGPRSLVRLAPIVVAAVLTLALPRSAAAHPVPFSYIDVRLDGSSIEVTVVAHAWDLIHDLKLGDITDERFLDPATLQSHAAAIAAIFGSRVSVDADGRTLAAGSWSAPEAVMDRLSVRMRARYEADGPPGSVRVTAVMFPYDPIHQTFPTCTRAGI
jgi:hypothetical protein